MDVRLIDPSDPLYPAEQELRFRVLREPLGFTREQVTYPLDAASLHFVGVEDGRVVGCVLFHPEGPEGSGRLLQMAVDPPLQGRGLGRQLVRALEAEVKRRGFTEVTMHARGEKVPFYEKLGYAVRGEPFSEVGIPHRHMWRVL